ncbi:MAG: hypothetical protein HEEMFOPI_02039 [Holosporales bacterium]
MIKELLLYWTSDKSEAQLLSEKENFGIKCEDIVNITVFKNNNFNRQNNGTVKFILRSNKIEFIIHPIIEYNYLISYFKNNNIKLIEQD